MGEQRNTLAKGDGSVLGRPMTNTQILPTAVGKLSVRLVVRGSDSRTDTLFDFVVV